MKKTETALKVNKNIIFQKIDKKLIAFDIEKSSLYTFNETAEYVFSKIKSHTPFEKITALLIKRYDIDEKTAAKDISALLKDLKKNKILE